MYTLCVLGTERAYLQNAISVSKENKYALRIREISKLQGIS